MEMNKGKDLVERLVKVLCCFPTCWEELVGEELADEVKRYLGRENEHDKED